ncbi:MAG: heavy-metal-associated domain-containing protein [Maribacter sp.]
MTSLLSENIIPGKHGKIFSTNAHKRKDLLKIKNAILDFTGVRDVIFNTEVFPKEFTVYTTSFVKIEDIENEVKRFGFHAVPKGIFQL